MSMASTQPAVQRGVVKQVLSGDAVVIRGQPKGGPPPERVVCLSNVTAPRLARRASPNQPEVTDTKDEPFAWEAREFLRTKLIGKEVAFTVEYKVPGSGREYGCIYLGKDINAENVTEAMVGEGLVEVRRGGIKATDENQQKLVQLEDTAKSAGKGKWVQGTGSDHIRDVTWTVEDPRKFVDSHHNKPISAVIEHVRDGCTVRAFLLPSFDYVTVMLSGIKCPMFKMDENGKQAPELYAEEAKYFTEVRLLQRDVQIILESTSNQNLLGTVLHPNGNIAELLLREGFARCVDWSMGVVSQGAPKLRAAERVAKEKRIRIWKDYTPSDTGLDIKEKSLQGKVMEVVNGDSLVIKTPSGQEKKIFLSSIKPPRPPKAQEEEETKKSSKQRMRPLYDIPYMFEAREFLRKKLVGKKVSVDIDYIQQASNDYPEKTCCTVTIGGINVAEALVSKGLATVIRYRQDDDQRSSHYDELLAAESRAEKKGAGVHSKKEPPIHRVADVSGDATKAKQFLPFLQRAGRSEAVAEFVATGSRVRLYLPRETCLITLLLSGIDCPKAERKFPSGDTVPGDPYGSEAQQFIKDMCIQREVDVEVEAVDKGGNFIGWMFVDGVNASIALVEEGLARVHFTAERSSHFKAFTTAEEKAKAAKLNVWSKYEEPKEKVEVVEEPVERKVNLKTVLVTEVCNDLHFFAQTVENGPQLEKLMEQLHQEMESNPPLAGAYTPKKGDMCAAKFVDGAWYRALVEKAAKAKGGSVRYHILYADYGNREVTDSSKMAVLPGTFHGLPAQAQEYALACVNLPEEPEAAHEAVDALYNDVLNRQCLLNTEYKGANVDHVTLLAPDTKDDVGLGLISEGLVLVEARREKRLGKLVTDYQKAQEKAKADHLNLWRYGDFTADDAKEFGYTR